MPGVIERFADFISRAGTVVTRVGEAMRRPVVVQPSNPTVAAPDARMPGAPGWAGGRIPTDTELTAAMQTVEAFFGRVTYDAGPSPARYSSYPATDLTPDKIAGAQQEAVAGYPLRWAEMIEQILSRDSHLSGIGQQRVDDVMKGTWRLIRTSADDVASAVRSFCEEAVRGIEEFEDGQAWLLWANAYCYNACEVTWRREVVTFAGPKGEPITAEVIVPHRLDPVHPKHFRFDLRTDEPLLWIGGGTAPLPYGKFLFYRGEGQHPITERRGYMWPCSWVSMFRSIGWSGWAAHVDRFAMPIPLIAYDGTIAQYAEYKQAYQDILNSLGTGKGAIYPREGATFEIKDPPAGGRSNDPHSAFSDACDSAQSVRVFGATLTAKIGNVGSFAATGQHMEVKYAREEYDARRLWSVNRAQLLTPMVRVNAYSLAYALTAAGYPCTPEQIIRRVPRGMQRVPRDVDPVQRMQLVSTGINDVGLSLDVEPLYDEFNFVATSDPKRRAPGRPQQVTSGGKVVGSVEAATEGAEAPKPEPATVSAKTTT